MSPPDSRSIRELLDALSQTPLGAELKEPERYRQEIYRELAEDDDPLLREIGEQLRDGVMRPHQMLDVPAYRTVIERKLEVLRQHPIDAARIRNELAELVDQAKRRQDHDPSP